MVAKHDHIIRFNSILTACLQRCRLGRRRLLSFLSALLALSAAVAFTAHAGDTIKIGLVSEITGVNAEAGSYTVNGTKLAIETINKNGGVLGKSLELVIEDNQSTNPGTVLAFSKLGGDKDIVAIIGPIRSTQVQAASPRHCQGRHSGHDRRYRSRSDQGE
ncbi:MAG: hypothetical protein RL083_662 [Pseudomonadota bacterium]|jgi:branched-chain amino acid transport system substrate-binding protein